jgi:hypothetical protein
VAAGLIELGFLMSFRLGGGRPERS